MNRFTKISFAAVLLLAATSCNEQFSEMELPAAASEKMVVVAGTAQTKTTLLSEADTFSVVWCDGDEISIWDELAGTTPAIFTENSIASGTAATASFEGSYLSGEELYALYPYGAADEFDYSLKRISFTLTTSQSYDATGSFASGASPAFASSSSEQSNFTFSNICGVLRLSLSTTDSEAFAITKIVVSSESDDLAGSAAYSIDSQTLVVDGQKEVTLDCGDSTALAADGTPAIFSIVLPPTSSPLTVAIYGSDNELVEELTTSSSTTIEANCVTWFENIVLETPVTDPDEGTTDPDEGTTDPDEGNGDNNDSYTQNSEEITLNATSYTFDGTTIPTEDNWIVEGSGNGYIAQIASALKAAYTENEDRRINLTVNLSTGIPASSFAECHALKSLTIGSTVTSYNTYAFSLCANLESVTINSAANITGHTFRECTSLTSVTVAASVTSIKDNAFMGCSALESISFPEVTSVTNLTFSDCSALKSINLPKVTSIGNNVFRNITALETITLGTDAASLSLGNCIFGSETEVTLSGVENATLNICSAITGTNVAISGNQLTCNDTAADGGTVTYTFDTINQ